MTDCEREKMIEVLEQHLVEDKHSRSNIRAKVKEEIMTSIETNMQTTFYACCVAVDKYLGGEYYQSKQNRLQKISHWATEDLVLEIFLAVLPFQKLTAIQNAAATLGAQLEYEDTFDGIKTAAELFAVVNDYNLLDIVLAGDSDLEYMGIISLWNLEPETLQFIEETQYLNPMLTKPKHWTNNINGGYLTVNKSVLLGSKTHHEEFQALDSLNISQDIAWSIDEDMLQYEETSKKPLDTPEKVRNYIQMTTISRKVCKGLIEKGNRFWFVRRNDCRGREYTQGYFCNFQSTSYKKSLLNFATKRYVTS